MRWAEKLRLRMRSVFRRGRVEQEVEEELRFHLEQQVEENLAAGMSAEEARYAARRMIGGTEQIKEECRDWRGVNWITSAGQDLRYAGRVFRRSPVFTATALVSLALGIGANSAIFTAADAILWKPLPVKDPGSLEQLSVTREQRGDARSIPAPFVDELRKSSTVFSGVTDAVADGLSFSLGGPAERIVGEAASPNFFSFLGVQPSLGRGFSADVQKGQWAAETVLSYRYWKSRFAGDERVIGRMVRLNKFPFTIVGVAPDGFSGLDVGFEPELWVPMTPPGQELRQMHLLSESESGGPVARLKTGVTVAVAEAATDAQFQQFLRELPPERRGEPGHIHLLPGSTGDHGFVAEYEKPLAVVMGMAGLVLLIACANVANMLLARAAARERELAVRASIGAGRARLIRQMVVENLLLWLVGGILGIAVASWTSQVLFGFLPQTHMRMVLDLRPDFRALLFTFFVSLASGLLFGLVPALTATRDDLVRRLKSGSSGSLGEGGGFSFRRMLVVSQVALSVLLLIVAGLFVRTLANLRATDFGFGTGDVLLFTMKPQVELYSPQQIRNMTAELVQRVGQLPGVQSAAIAEDGPLGTRGGQVWVGLANGEMMGAILDEVRPGFFQTIGMRRLDGRDFSPGDRDGSEPVVILNEVLARTLFGRENPLGRMVVAKLRTPEPYRVVGVVRSSRYFDLRAAPPPAIYFAIQQATAYMPTLHVHVAQGRSTADVALAVRHEFDTLDKDVPVFNIKLLEDRVNDSLARERLVSALAGTFGALALLLAGVGLYGVMAYMVACRTREIGIRMALGSSPRAVLWMVGKEALALLGVGTAAGVAAGLIAARMVSSQLFGLSATDPITIFGATATMLLVTCLATFLPARRASHVDPMVALRHE